MKIRKSSIEDVKRIMEIFAAAKRYMVEHGNASQWAEGYPGEDILKDDIAAGNNYVMEENGEIVATFSFIIGDDPTYQIIENGKWSDCRRYGTIHRLASSGKTRGISRACFEYCVKMIDYIRIDTHKNNVSMRAAVESFGFRECGIIYGVGGAERIAYDYLR